ncbi:hemerythrin domain-containing protein [Brevundimonas viscosa]|uniref:Hemerythrin HHE cation binding domain-containing protein n=1 Tax=Brevundimonas viscosa TaxID=871741 RepID=A0A1I6QGF0_9CAUL|nr:hemerythrin domain-containing protein [Brevundimonas viscosa]SFS51573.1 Hemerythrin HHE cation binding domain-containing protein [Brevundimonas viscosa]
MSVVDKILSKVTPVPGEEKRAEATANARARCQSGDWLSLALDHHDRIRECFAACRRAESAEARAAAMKELALILNGHSLAEEVVLYPALAQAGEKLHAGHAYTEQTTAKMQMAELENIQPSTPEWMDKLKHIEGAVLTHMFEEESSWFLHLKENGENQAHLTERFREEFERYCGGEGPARSGERRGDEAAAPGAVI